MQKRLCAQRFQWDEIYKNTTFSSWFLFLSVRIGFLPMQFDEKIRWNRQKKYFFFSNKQHFRTFVWWRIFIWVIGVLCDMIPTSYYLPFVAQISLWMVEFRITHSATEWIGNDHKMTYYLIILYEFSIYRFNFLIQFSIIFIIFCIILLLY